MRRASLLVILAVAGLIAAGVQIWSAPTIEVPAGDDAQAAIDSAPRGSTVRLLAGRHEGPLTIARSMSLEGEEGASVIAPRSAEAALHVTADETRVSDLEVVGGWTGLELDDATGALVQNVTVRGSDLQGILIYKAGATLEDVHVSALHDPHAQGIEVLSAPDTTVRDSTVIGGKVGIVGHLSDVHFENNTVMGTTQIGVMIREMSTGSAHGNHVSDASGAGLYCGDMSVCEFAGNTVRGLVPAGSARSSAGWGLVVNYRSTASSSGDSLTGVAGGTVALTDSRITKDSPLQLGDGAAAIWPALLSTLVWLLVLAALFTVTRRLLRNRMGEGTTRPWAATAGAALLITGVAVQSFHMLEHVVQLSRVRFDGVPSRGSLVGSVADTEWVHFLYNLLVAAGLSALLALRRRGWKPLGDRAVGDNLILAAALLQSYHVVEHTFKVVQHEVTGAKVNPGILGGSFDLVLLHFGLNAAIYIAFIAAAIAYSRPRGETQPSGELSIAVPS